MKSAEESSGYVAQLNVHGSDGDELAANILKYSHIERKRRDVERVWGDGN